MSQTDALVRNLFVYANLKLEHSTANACASLFKDAISGSSVLPTAVARNPAALIIAAAISVVVVLPSVPVMATIGLGFGESCSN